MSGQRTLTIRFIGDSKSTTRAIKDVVSGLDDAESAGKRYAAAIDAMTDKAVRGSREQQAAIAMLSNALGSDAVAAIERAGGSVDQWVADLNKAGLSLDELRADVDSVADAIRRAEDANGTFRNLGASAEGASKQIDMVRDSGDQSRSVLANMVGNSVQDLGALGGVAGTAGMALGQFAEYATEGNISLSGIAKVAGPMAAVGAAVAGVSWAVGKLRENTEKAQRASEGMLAVQEDLRDGKFEDAATTLQKEWSDTISTLEDMGFTTEEVIGHLTGQRDITAELERKIWSKRQAMSDDLRAQDAYDQQAQQLTKNLKLATAAFAEQGEQLDETTSQTSAIENELRRLNGTSEETGRVVDLSLLNPFGRLIDRVEDVGDVMQETTEDAVDPLQQALDELGVQYDILMGKFDDREALDRANEALANLMLTASDGESTWTDLRQASDEYARSLAEVVMSMEDVPTEVRSQYLAWIDEGQLNLVRSQLDAVATTRTAEFQIMIQAVASAELKQMEIRFNRDINGNGVIGRSSGGPVWPGGVFAVGDNPDGSWNRTTELFVPNTAGNILSARDSRAALGGNTNIYITQVVPPVVDKGAVGRELIDAILAAQRQSGPVFATVRS